MLHQKASSFASGAAINRLNHALDRRDLQAKMPCNFGARHTLHECHLCDLVPAQCKTEKVSRCHGFDLSRPGIGIAVSTLPRIGDQVQAFLSGPLRPRPVILVSSADFAEANGLPPAGQDSRELIEGRAGFSHQFSVGAAVTVEPQEDVELPGSGQHQQPSQFSLCELLLALAGGVAIAWLSAALHSWWLMD